MFLALLNSSAKPFHLVDALLFFSIVTGIYSGGCCAVWKIDSNSSDDASLIDSVDESRSIVHDGGVQDDPSTYKDCSVLSIAGDMDDYALLDAIKCLLKIAKKYNDADLIKALQLSEVSNDVNKENDATALQDADLNHHYIIKFFRDNIHTAPYESEGGLLACAIPFGNNKLIELLVESGANVNRLDANKNTALHKAVSFENLGIVKVLLMAGAKVDCIGLHTPIGAISCLYVSDCITPLQAAVLKMNVEIVKVLLDSKADPNYCSEGEFTPLRMAVDVNSDSIVEALLKAGAKVDEIGTSRGILINAVLKSSKPEIVKSLISSGAKAECSQDYILLFLAIANGYNEFIELLIQHGANPNYIHNGNRPLHIAAYYLTRGFKSSSDIFELLIAAGADVNCKNEEGLTPLIIIITRLRLVDDVTSTMKRVISILLNNGADIDMIDDKTGNTALHHAAHYSNGDCISLLLENGAKRDIRNHHGFIAEENAPSNQLSKEISMAAFVTREPARLVTNARSSIRKIIIDSSQARWHQPLSKMISTLSLPKTLNDFLLNHISTPLDI
ncbi:MAG: ankyrin repeat domain-containing protein [Candidatus Endonucleobacter bathymodioli]|uniref:Ankyrin repeat domain-containing protein n=1 Tax=Candidatus Endonucleibacter bathymodioli TaxID=539814 RepID=A0AA90SU54_9GAMM|nr:ankyrin repeat domain-containing protein [Candidatus Endonucleobacter bathymodioli]